MSGSNGSNELRPVDDPLDECAVIVNPTDRDIAVAERLVIVHRAEEWVTGRFCRNCHARYPCRLSQWGVDVLLTAGWSKHDIAELAERSKSGDVPWR